jgi:hypothetical protein
MLEYTKTILLKVSFDNSLFEKELRKGLRMLEREELWQLRTWCYDTFAAMHLLTLSKVFHHSAGSGYATK